MANADLIAQIKRAEAAELETALGRHEAEATVADALICRGCGRRWSDVFWTRPMPPIWIPEAKAHWHLRCWQRHQERT